MGGLVSRSASEIAGARDKIVGIVHGVQPVHGAPAAYWRMKGGFEGFDWGTLGISQMALGNDGPKVTAVLGNIPGGLELLPNKQHRTNAGGLEWLTITDEGHRTLALPKSNPYEEIYRVKAIVKPEAGEIPSTNTYWGLVDPELLNPEKSSAKGKDPDDQDRAALNDPWSVYLDNLKAAETMHDQLNPPGAWKLHPQTLCVSGNGHHTADVIELRIESKLMQRDPYPNKCFRGFFTNNEGKDMQAVLRDPDGEGDATVVLSSAVALEASGRPLPGDLRTDVEHQPAFEENGGAVQQWAIQAVAALAKHRFHEQRTGPGAK